MERWYNHIIVVPKVERYFVHQIQLFFSRIKNQTITHRTYTVMVYNNDCSWTHSMFIIGWCGTTESILRAVSLLSYRICTLFPGIASTKWTSSWTRRLKSNDFNKLHFQYHNGTRATHTSPTRPSESRLFQLSEVQPTLLTLRLNSMF